MRISDWSSDVCSSDLQDSEKAGAGGWLQHAVGRRDTRSGQRGNAERKRRRKLLEGLALLRSACVGGKKVGDLCQPGQGCGRRSGFTDKRLSVFAQEEERRDFAGLTGTLPVPCTCRV